MHKSLSVQLLIQNLGTSQLRLTGPFVGKTTGYQWIPRTKGQLCGNRFYVITSSLCRTDLDHEANAIIDAYQGSIPAQWRVQEIQRGDQHRTVAKHTEIEVKFTQLFSCWIPSQIHSLFCDFSKLRWYRELQSFPVEDRDSFITGLYSLSGQMSYCKIAWRLENVRLISAALLPRCLSNFRAIRKV